MRMFEKYGEENGTKNQRILFLIIKVLYTIRIEVSIYKLVF